jgi:hypothetical protein
VTADLRPAELADELASAIPPGTHLDAVGGAEDVTVVGVGARPDGVLVRFRWMSYPHVLGFVLPTDGAYGRVDTAAQWAVDARILLLEELGTGLVALGRRERHDDVIELSHPSWPHDRRFHVSGLGPGRARRHFADAARDGFDVTTPRSRRRQGSLLSWQRAFANTTAGPMLGHATASRVDDVTGRLDQCQVVAGAPATVALALCALAVHTASWHGLRRVVTDLDDPVLELLGFTSRGGTRVVETTFLSMGAWGGAGPRGLSPRDPGLLASRDGHR